MKIRTVLDGNAFYDIDEECMEHQKRKKEQGKEEKYKVSGTGEKKSGKDKNVQ